MKPQFNFKVEKRDRKTFYASDSLKLEADIWCEFMGYEPTNPTEWNNTLRMEAGKAIELQMLKVLKENKVVAEDYDQATIPTTEIEREGVKIRMKFDATAIKSTIKANNTTLPQSELIEIGEGEPIEIKSINNANSFDIAKYMEGNPRESYCMQLAMYCDALGKDRGHLFVASVDGLHYFWFELKMIGAGKYQCGNIVVDIYAEYKRFASIWKKFQNKQEPNWIEQVYKKPVAEIDWTTLSTTKIGDARNNRKVIGSDESWKLLYSPFCDLILEKQGIKERGYTPEELEYILAKTAGYSSKKKKADLPSN